MEQEIIDKKRRACLATSKWVKKNPEKARAAQKKYREKNRDKVRATYMDWHYRNMAKKKEAISDFISQHGVEPTRDDLVRMSRSFYWKKYIPAHKEKRKLQYSNPAGRARILLRSATKRSLRKGQPIPELTLENVKKLLEPGVCSVTGLKFVYAPSGENHPLAPSLDRVDSKKSYTIENTRAVCWAINAGCAQWGLETYLEIAKKAIEQSGR